MTLYARGARVRRVLTVGLDGSRVRITGLPAALIDDTVRVEAEGDALVTALHVGLDAPPPAEAAAEEVPEVRAARRRVALAEADVERLEAALAALATAPIVAAPPPRRDEPPPAWAAVVAARHALITLRTQRELGLRDHHAAARRALDEARAALAATIDRDRRAGSARAAKLHELRKHVELELSGQGEVTLAVEYQVAAARWAPSYVARIDDAAVRVELRAVIAQDTGEDWTGVALRLSTAEPERFEALPELAAQRIGRRQSELPRPGFRAPPVGAGELYLDYVRAFPDAFDDAPTASLAVDSRWDDQAELAAPAFEPSPPPQAGYGAPPGAAPARALAAMAPPPSFVRTMQMAVVAAPAPMAAKGRALADMPSRSSAELGGDRSRKKVAELDLAAFALPAPAIAPPQLDYGNLRMAPPSSRVRGMLIPAPRDPRTAALDGEVAAAAARIDVLTLPGGCVTDWPHTYDYAFASDGKVDVRADGAWHSIAVTARPSTAILRHVAVPREQPDVFRIAEIANPFDGPLLPGPIDVYDRGTFLVTSSVDQTAPGARVEVGLGVDAQVKIARNTEFSEEATGMLRGALRLHHAIAIDIDNHADRAIELEVRERIPVTRDGDDDVEVTLGKVEPAWERWTPDPEAPRDLRLRGGYRWRLTVPAHAKRALRVAYDVKIANKLELVGGNRREA